MQVPPPPTPLTPPLLQNKAAKPPPPTFSIFSSRCATLIAALPASGYSYSGRVAGHAWRPVTTDGALSTIYNLLPTPAFDCSTRVFVSGIRRVFVLGPSHKATFSIFVLSYPFYSASALSLPRSSPSRPTSGRLQRLPLVTLLLRCYPHPTAVC